MNKQEQLKLAFHLACDMKHFEITKIMIENGLNINDGLFIACKSGCLEMVQLLLEKGADPTDNYNYAIRWACTNGHTNVVVILLQDGRADPTELDNFAIKRASYWGYVDVVKVLLQDGRVEVDDLTIDKATTKDIKDMLKAYKYRVDGPEYRCMKEEIGKK